MEKHERDDSSSPEKPVSAAPQGQGTSEESNRVAVQSLVTPAATPPAQLAAVSASDQQRVTVFSERSRTDAEVMRLSVLPKMAICQAEEEACKLKSDTLRKVVSHIFGRNKTCTRQIPDNVWVQYCRKHYQRLRYRDSQFPLTQNRLARAQINRTQVWSNGNAACGQTPTLNGWSMVLRKRAVPKAGKKRARNDNDSGDENEENLDDNDSPVTTPPSWMLEIVDRHGLLSTEEMLHILERLQDQLEDKEDPLSTFPDVEILPSFDGVQAPPHARRQSMAHKRAQSAGNILRPTYDRRPSYPSPPQDHESPYHKRQRRDGRADEDDTHPGNNRRTSLPYGPGLNGSYAYAQEPQNHGQAAYFPYTPPMAPAPYGPPALYPHHAQYPGPPSHFAGYYAHGYPPPLPAPQPARSLHQRSLSEAGGGHYYPHFPPPPPQNPYHAAYPPPPPPVSGYPPAQDASWYHREGRQGHDRRSSLGFPLQTTLPPVSHRHGLPDHGFGHPRHSLQLRPRAGEPGRRLSEASLDAPAAPDGRAPADAPRPEPSESPYAAAASTMLTPDETPPPQQQRDGDGATGRPSATETPGTTDAYPSRT